MSESLTHVSRNLRLVSALTMLSRVFGLIRDSVMAATFGNGPLLDAFTVAFRIPNTARALLGEGALATAFLPAFVGVRHAEGRDAANRLAVAVVLSLAVLLGGLLAALELAFAAISRFALLSEDARLLLQLMLILMPHVGLICLTSQLSALLHAENRFSIPALLPSVLNLVWLLGLWLIVPRWSDPRQQLFAMTWCVLAAGTMQLLLTLPPVFALGYRYVADWRHAWPGVLRIAGQMLPVIGGLMVTQINTLLDSFLAWGLARPENGPEFMPWPGSVPYPLTTGSASAMFLGQRLYQFPLGVFGVALGTVLFPLFAAHAQQGHRERLREDFSLGLRLVAAIGIPASAGLVLLADPIARLCFQYGAFDDRDARETAAMIAGYGCGVWANCGILIIYRGFYALGERITPMRIGVAALGLNVVLNLCLVWPLAGLGLALATSLTTMLQCLVAAMLFRRLIGGWQGRDVATAILRACVATLVMSLAVWATFGLVQALPGWSGKGMRVLLPVLVAIITYFLTAWLIGFREPWQLLAMGGRHSPQAAGPDKMQDDATPSS
jgi:putative peptidoglycan lipid II flippase